MTDEIARANRIVPLASVLRELGVDVPLDSPAHSLKTYCPFGFTHADGGLETAFRIYYRSNTGYCFAGCGFFTPVWLASHASDRPAQEVAIDLLTAYGEVAGDDQQRWEALLAEDVPAIDTASLAQALLVACAQAIPDWRRRQFEDLAEPLSKCLTLLDRIKTPDDAWEWLSVAKTYMTRSAQTYAG